MMRAYLTDAKLQALETSPLAGLTSVSGFELRLSKGICCYGTPSDPVQTQ